MGSQKKDKFNFLPYLIVFSLLGVVVFLQQKIDSSKGEFEKIEEFSYLPSGAFLRFTSLEYKELVADILWLRAVQFVGGRDPSGQDYRWFYGVLDRVTDLDPLFAYPYQFGGIVLAVLSDEVELSNKILQKGLKNRPDVWQIPFYLGFNYFYHIKDFRQAAKYMEITSKLEGHLGYLPLLTASLYTRGEDPKTALAFLEGMYRETKDMKMREKILNRMKEIVKENKL